MNITLSEVNSENISAFMLLAPGRILPDFSGRHMIGALTGEKGSLVPSGLLIFDIAYTGAEKSRNSYPSAILSWLYVDENMRETGIGSALMDGFLNILRNTGVGEVRCTLSLSDDDTYLKSFLEKKGFDLSVTERISLVRPLIHYYPPRKRKEGTSSVKSFRELTPKEQKSIPEIFGVIPGTYDRKGRLIPDSDLSCAVFHNKQLSGIYLVSTERTVRDNLRLKCFYIRVLPGIPAEKIREMLHFSFSRALAFYGPEVPVQIETGYPPSVSLLKFLIKDCPVEEVLTCCLSGPF